MTFRTPLTLTTVSSLVIFGHIPEKMAPNGEKQWRLEDPLLYEVGELGSGDTIFVHSGFITDLASVPRALWWFIPPFGKHASAAVVHDFLYRTKPRTRREADAIFHEAMLVSDVPRLRARLMWAAVRVGGWPAWKMRGPAKTVQ